MKLRRRNAICRTGSRPTARHLLFSIAFFLLLFQPFTPAHAEAAHRLIDQEIHVKLNEDGSADILDRRKADLQYGTENFIVIGNLGKSKIKHFTVSENGKAYTYERDWDIDATREQKKFKYGIIPNEEAYELCWGIGDPGIHEYTVRYTVTNFIKGLKDGQMLFWKFVNDDQDIPPEQMKIIIDAGRLATFNEEDMWAFGFEGTFTVEDGLAIAKSEKPLTSSDYGTLLMRFPENTFKTADNLNKTFKKVQKKAFKNSDFSNEKPWFVTEFVYPALAGIGMMVLFWLGFVVLGLLFGKKFERKYKDEYCRGIPYERHFLELDYMREQMHLRHTKDMMNALILKWLRDGKIELLKGETQGLLFKREATDLKFLSVEMTEDMCGPERKMFRTMLKASDNQYILKEEAFTAWARKHDMKITDWSSQTWNYSTRKLLSKGYLRTEEKRTLFIKTEEKELTEEGAQLEKRLYTFINYLHDYSLINEREAFEVKLWEDLMIWAAFLGLTHVVKEQFEKLYPDAASDSFFGYVSDTNAFVSRVESASSSGTSSSSAGGGGGSYGGGSGGGTR